MDRHPQHSAVYRVLGKFIESGFVIQNVNDGNGDKIRFIDCTNSYVKKHATESITSVDQSTVEVYHPELDASANLVFILGNGDDEIVADWSCKDNQLDDLIENIVCDL